MESKSKVFQTQKVVQKKYSSSNESMLFLRKTDETIWNLPPPFHLTPLFLSIFFMTLLFV